MLQTNIFNGSDFLFTSFCSNQNCIQGKEGFASFQSQRCPVCDEPAALPQNQLHLNTLNMVQDTPLVLHQKIASYVGVKSIYLKDEGKNPSGSFKDRGSFTAYLLHVIQALQRKKRATDIVVGTVSTGNMAISTAWMGASLGIKNFVVVHKDTSQEKIDTIEFAAGKNDTTVFLVDGEYSNFHEKVYQACKTLRNEGQLVFAELTDDVFRIIGYESLFVELMDQCIQKNIKPDFILIPGASGALFRVAVAAMGNMKKSGRIQEIPHIVLVQEQGGDPISAAFARDEEYVSPIHLQDGLVASAINVSQSRSGNPVLKILRDRYHLGVSVNAQEIITAQKTLHKEHLFVEPAGAAGVAAVKKLTEEGKISAEDTVVCVLTGMEMKKRELGQKHDLAVQHIYCTIDDLEKQIINEFKN